MVQLVKILDLVKNFMVVWILMGGFKCTELI